MQGGLRLFRLAGIDVYLDWSLIIIFALITASLGLGVFPQWHPQWSAATNLVTAFVAAVLFLASVLAHEYSHALVGRARGMTVNRITLFIFGGMASRLLRNPLRTQRGLKRAAGVLGREGQGGSLSERPSTADGRFRPRPVGL
jgi:Zn-dependent protease